MKAYYLLLIPILFFINAKSQLKWQNVDTAFGRLPENFHVYKTTDSLDEKPFIAYYAEAKLQDKKLQFTADTTKDRRLTPATFYERCNNPLLVVNCTFFSYETNRSLNTVIMDGELVAFNIHSIPMREKDTFQYRHPLGSAIGISKKRKADVAWLYTDSTYVKALAFQNSIQYVTDSNRYFNLRKYKGCTTCKFYNKSYASGKKWKMQTAVGGGPVLLQNGDIKITNEEELKFSGKTGLTDKHPRTAMGYTADGRLIIMVIQGRSANAAGATLVQEAQLLKDLGCVEALNLDGGGGSCMLINGKETITPSEKGAERPVPAVFLIKVNK
jgi:hypothetical protein